MKILVRFRNPNGKTLYVQKRSLNLFVFVAYIFWKIFYPKKPGQLYPEWGWYDWSDYSNVRYKIDEEMNYYATKLKELKEARTVFEKRLAAEKIKIEKLDTHETKGHSAPFWVNIDDLKPVGLDIKDPGTQWKEVLTPKFSGTQRKTASGNDFKGGFPEGTKSRYIDKEDLKKFSVSFEDQAFADGVDHLVAYDPERNKQQKTKEFNPRNRKKQKGESDHGHSDRLRAIQSGEDISDWEPY